MSRSLHDWMWTRAFELLGEVERKTQQYVSFGDRMSSWQAPVDVFATDHGLVVRIAMPGVAIQDVNVTIERDILTVRGHRSADVDPPHSVVKRLEIPYGEFARSLVLPRSGYRLIDRTDQNGCITLKLNCD